MKAKLPTEGAAFAWFAALALLSGISAAQWRIDGILYLLVPPILVAPLFYRRPAFWGMQFVAIAVGGVVIHLLYPNPIRSVKTILSLSAAVFAMAEILYRVRRQRERTDATLRENEQRFRALIENSSDGIVLLNAEGTLLYASPSITRMLGYSSAEVVGTKALTHVHEADLPSVAEQLESLLAKPGATVTAQFRRRHRNGAWLWFDAIGTNLLNEPSVHAVVVNYRDITERKRAEIRIHAFSRLAQKLAAATTPREAARIILDCAQDLLGWDAGFLHLYDKTAEVTVPILTIDVIDGRKVEVPESLIGVKPTPMSRRVLSEGPQLILRGPRSAELNAAGSEKAERASGLSLHGSVLSQSSGGKMPPVSGDRISAECGRSEPDLTPIGNTARRSASLMFVPILDGGRTVGILSVQSYAAEAYRAEDLETLQTLANHCAGAMARIQEAAERQQSEIRTAALSKLAYRLSATNTPKDAARIIVDTAQELFGWDACALDVFAAGQNLVQSLISIDTIDGRRVNVPDPLTGKPPSPMMRRVIERGAELILRGDSEEAPLEFTGFGDTSRRSASLMFVPIRNGEAVIGSLTIQSYRPKAYQPRDLMTLQALADHCGGALERLNLETQLRHSQKLEAVGQLSAGVAHDFNNILTIIQGHVDLLLAKTALDAEARESLAEVAVAAERAANLTAQLLAFSRKRRMQPRWLDLADVVARASQMVCGLLGETIALQLICPRRLPPIHADATLLEHVIINLALNARDAMPKGGNFTIELAAAEIDEAYVHGNREARPGRFVRMTVTDTGCGMEQETLAKLFEPFFTTKDVGKGSGLGLASVYGIIKQHQGWIEVESRLGFGTSFRIYFPSPDDLPQSVPSAGSPEQVKGGTETVLIVEDEPSVRALLARVLGTYGYRVLEAGNGREALEVWRSQSDQIDLLLTDLIIPGELSGIELARMLKAESPRLKVLHTSGHRTDLKARNSALSEGAGLLSKPFNPPTLAAMVRKCLDAEPHSV
ncbi:MAG: PAS domain S-box protein [Verrucomicrobia bacterium]|nr:PAS domain S-box protein [Verrucomicrobiota bacterium]